MDKRQQWLSRTAFTLIELLVVISIIALLISILLPALQQARVSAQKIKSASNMRSLHQGLVLYSQGNDGYYPGYSLSKAQADGNSDPWKWYGSPAWHWSMSAQTRLAELLAGRQVPPEIMLNPADPVQAKEPFQMADYDSSSPWATPRFSYENFSYGVLEIGAPWAKKEHCLAEWKNSMGSDAIMLGDRMLFPPPSDWEDPSTFTSMYGGPGSDFSMGVVFNDGHTEWSGDAFYTTEYNGHHNSRDFVYRREAEAMGNEQSPEAANGRATTFLVAWNPWNGIQPEH